MLDFAEVINKEYANLIDISLISNVRSGSNQIRCQSHANERVPAVSYRVFSSIPHVELRLTETISSQLEPLVLDGKLDFALILSADRNNKLVKHHLLNDRVYLCVPDPC